MPDSVLLGFDYGWCNIGVAVGQTITCSANPLTILKANKGEPDWQDVAELIKTWRADALVVGIPTTLQGQSQRTTEQAKAFADQLAKRFNLPVHRIDERLSSIEAREQVHRNPHSKRKAYDNIDDYAAVIILETYLKGSH